MPQETILFDHAALTRETTLGLTGTASCLVLEAAVLGRAAMDDMLSGLALRDHRRVLRDGVPLLVEPVQMTTASLSVGPGVLQGARAFAGLAQVGQGAEATVDAVLNEPGVSTGARGFDGKLTVRVLAVDG